MEVGGVEPAGKSASCPLSICVTAVLSEALTEELTEISDKDRQILVTCVVHVIHFLKYDSPDGDFCI